MHLDAVYRTRVSKCKVMHPKQGTYVQSTLLLQGSFFLWAMQQCNTAKYS